MYPINLLQLAANTGQFRNSLNAKGYFWEVRSSHRHFVIRLNIKLLSLFFTILSFIGGGAVFSQVSVPDINSKFKLSPSLVNLIEVISMHDSIPVQVFITDTSSLHFAENTPDKIQYVTDAAGVVYGIKIHLSKKKILALAQDPLIKFIELIRHPVGEFKQEGLDLTLNEVTFLQNQNPQLAGNEMNLCIKENLFDTTDIDFKGRTGSLDLASPIIDMHATNMASIGAGGGNSSPTAKGVAWDTYISSSDFINLLPDPDSHFIDNRISVQNHAYGTGIENYYGMETALYDQHTNRLPWLIHVFSSGNIGDQSPPDGIYAGLPGVANLTGQFKQSKNSITVGATDSLDHVVTLSSGGPAFDGRIKPEVVAYGHGGSSGAAAVVSGVSILIQEEFLKSFGELPPSSLVKALLINTADDIAPRGPDYKSGFGSVNAYEAIRTITENRFSIQSIENGETIFIAYAIPENITTANFTITWNDPAGNILTTKALVNDLDIQLLNIDNGDVWLPWVLSTYPHEDSLQLPSHRGTDRLNNIEKITVDSPASGNYLLHIKGSEIKNAAQEFTLVWQFEETNYFQWTYPTKGDHLVPGNKNILRWNSTATENGQIEYRLIGSDWILFEPDIQPASGYAEWLTMDQNGLAQLRWTNGDITVVSDTFLITNPLEPEVALLCADSLVINWEEPGNADSFEIFTLGLRHLEHYAFVTDTFFIEENASPSQKYYAVAPIFDHLQGPLSYAFDFTLQGAGCFLNSFYLRHVSDDKAFFGAGLSAIDEIDYIVFEERQNTGFIALQTYQEIDSTVLFFESGKLKQGINEFRLKIVLKNGEIIYSQVERVYYTGDLSVLIFPNPASSAGPINILTDGIDDFALKIFDVLGREIIQFEHLDSPVLLPLMNLTPGVFIMQLHSEDGMIHSGVFQVYK